MTSDAGDRAGTDDHGRQRLPGTPDPMLRLQASGAGMTLAADRWGTEGATPVLLLHGGGQTRHAWRGAGETLGAAGYDAYCMDLRGHGDSDWSPDGVYHYTSFVDDIVGVAGQLGRTPVLVGASLGGICSLLATGEDRRLRPAALVMVDIGPYVEREGVQRIRGFMQANPDGFASLEEVADAIAAYQPHRRRPDSLEGLGKNVRLDTRTGRYHWHWDPTYFASRRDMSVDERERRLVEAARGVGASGIPMLLVRGGLSDVLSLEGAERFLELVPHAEFVNVTDAAHMVAGDRNDIFAGAVIEFLQRVAPPTVNS